MQINEYVTTAYGNGKTSERERLTHELYTPTKNVVGFNIIGKAEKETAV